MRILALSLLILTALFLAAPAFCFYCYTGPCYSSAVCGRDCVCLRTTPTEGGKCVSFQHAEAMK